MVRPLLNEHSNGDKNNMGETMKKGPWSVEEDQKLIAYIWRYGIWNWSQMARPAGLARSGKSCRLRWMNYLRPNIRHGNFSKEEEEIIIRWHQVLGNRWSAIAAKLHGRTDNEVKNYWNTRLKRRARTEEKPVLQGPQICSPPISLNNIDRSNVIYEGSSQEMSKFVIDATPKLEPEPESSVESLSSIVKKQQAESESDDGFGDVIEKKVNNAELEPVCVPALGDVAMEEDLEALLLVSSGFVLPYSLQDYSLSNECLIYDLWES